MSDMIGSQMGQRKVQELFGLNIDLSEKLPYRCTDLGKYYLTSFGQRALWNSLL